MEQKTFFLVVKVLSFRRTKQTSENVTDTTLSLKPSYLQQVKLWKKNIIIENIRGKYTLPIIVSNFCIKKHRLARHPFQKLSNSLPLSHTQQSFHLLITKNLHIPW